MDILIGTIKHCERERVDAWATSASIFCKTAKKILLCLDATVPESLFDLVDFWFGLSQYDIQVLSVNKFENNAYDNAVIKLVGSPEVILEISLLSWRNNFRAELVGSEGSINLDSLCKWGPSQLTIRNRKRPSGKPDEEISTLVCSDPTWEAEYRHFVNLIDNRNLGNLESNLKISQLFDKLREII